MTRGRGEQCAGRGPGARPRRPRPPGGLACTLSGLRSYCDRYSDGMKRVLKTFGPVPDFSGATVEKVNQVRRPRGPGGSWLPFLRAAAAPASAPRPRPRGRSPESERGAAGGRGARAVLWVRRACSLRRC